VAALFAVHPLNVESVAWIAERKNLLSTLFGLTAIASYGWYARRESWRRYLVVVFSFALSLMSKPMLVTLPLLLGILDYWPLERNRSKSLRFLFWEKLPLALLSAASCVVTIIAQRRGGAVRSLAALPFLLRVQNALLSYFKYLYKMAWPAKLAVFYPLLGIRRELWLVAVCALGLVAVTLFFFQLRPKLPWVWAGWLWYVVSLLPVIGLVQVGDQAMADRYAYVPLVGIFVALVWSAAEWAKQARWRQWAATVGAAAVLIALSASTWREEAYWHDSVALFTRALEVTQNNYLAHDNLSNAFIAAGRPKEAVEQLNLALTTPTVKPR
jgi:hypothetical protein